jgi:hypothetical protein
MTTQDLFSKVQQETNQFYRSIYAQTENNPFLHLLINQQKENKWKFWEQTESIGILLPNTPGQHSNLYHLILDTDHKWAHIVKNNLQTQLKKPNLTVHEAPGFEGKIGTLAATFCPEYEQFKEDIGTHSIEF